MSVYTKYNFTSTRLSSRTTTRGMVAPLGVVRISVLYVLEFFSLMITEAPPVGWDLLSSIIRLRPLNKTRVSQIE